MSAGLIDWVSAPSEGVMQFADDDGGWERKPYVALAEQVQRIAAGIAAASAANESIALVLPAGADFTPSFFAALWAGHTPCPIAPPTPLSDPGEYVQHAAAILRAATPRLVIADPVVGELVALAVERSSLNPAPPILSVAELERAGLQSVPATPADLGLLQFTSGSSGTPRGVRVSWGNLERNVAMIRRWVGVQRHESGATWLPLYHDMGLIGLLLQAVLYGNGLLVMRPEQFIRDPARWLECMGRLGAGYTATPPFGLAYCRKRVTAERIAELDFSTWRSVVIGAERVDAAVLAAFAQFLAPQGFQPTALMPAYGLAEATLAVNGVPRDATVTLLSVDSAEMTNAGRPRILRRATLDGAISDLGEGNWLVGCGRPLDGLEVELVNPDGATVPDGEVGEIVIRGDTVACGYTVRGEGGSTSFTDDGLRTGDAGFRDRGELFVLGRIGDSLKLRGKHIYMEDLEERLSRHAGVRRGKLAAFAGAHADGPALVVLVEQDQGSLWMTRVAQLVRDQFGDGLAVHLFAGELRCIMRTSSGKPRRRAMWEAWRRGELNARPIAPALSAVAEA